MVGSGAGLRVSGMVFIRVVAGVQVWVGLVVRGMIFNVAEQVLSGRVQGGAGWWVRS
ncbi:MAG: hypothetical protein ACPL0F_05475 [bacterium]